jgi:hypothetical protein
VPDPCHTTFAPEEHLMIELLTVAMIVGQIEIGPGIIQTDYLNNSTEIVTVIEDRN